MISIFAANQPTYREHKQLTQDGKALIMRIHKNDMMLIEDEKGACVMRVALFSDGIISFVSHHEANVDARNRDKNDPFQYLRKAPSKLQELKARIVGVSPLGYVNDPGFQP